jgi:hypothetical protein
MGKKFTQYTLILFLFIAGIVSCIKEDINIRNYPCINTLEVDSILESGAVFNGEVIQIGTQQITEYGFVWNDKIVPELSNSEKITFYNSIGTGCFSAFISTTLKKGKTYNVRAYAKTKDFTVYGKKVTFLSLGCGSPIIEDFVPKEGLWGDTVKIFGERFSFVIENNIVTFGNIQATVINCSDTVITCLVPKGIYLGNVYISVSIADQKIKSNECFNLPTPSLKSFHPDSGTFLDTVVIYGKNFSKELNKNTVSFNEHQADIISSTDSSLTVIVPLAIRNQFSKIIITTNSLIDTSKNYFSILPPSVSNISNTSGKINSFLSISGNNFNPDIQGNSVLFENNYAEIIEAKKNKLVVKVPDGIYANRTNNIKVEVAEQGDLSLESFTITNPWIQKAHVPYGNVERYEETGFSIQNFGYIGLGEHYSMINSTQINEADAFWKYNPENNIWTKESDFPGGARKSPISFVIGKYAYVGLGYTETGIGNREIWKFDPDNCSWAKIADFPVDPGYKPVCLSTNSYGFVCTKAKTKNFWKYDPTIDKWTQLTDFDDLKVGESVVADAGFVIDDKIFIYGPGESNYQYKGKLFEFNMNTLKWIRREDMYHTGNGYSGFTIKNFGYIMDASSINEYNPTTNTWRTITNFPTNFSGTNVVFCINDKIYIDSGNMCYFFPCVVPDFWEYDPLYQ